MSGCADATDLWSFFSPCASVPPVSAAGLAGDEAEEADDEEEEGLFTLVALKEITIGFFLPLVLFSAPDPSPCV